MPAPKNSWTPVAAGGALDESIAPARVGGSGLTDCLNLIYHREGTWGKRSGSSVAYKLSGGGAFPANPYVSGVRWYRAYPTPLTKTVFAAEGSLWAADDIGSKPTKLLDFDKAPTEPIQFCAARDPNAMAGTGSDVLIICGGKTNLGFATEFLLITTDGPNGPGSVGQNPAPTAKITLRFTRNAGSSPTPDPSDAFQITYAVLPTDNATTIAQNLCDLINQAAAVATNGTGPDPSANNPFLCQAYTTAPSVAFNHPSGCVIHMGALFAGTAGNDITYTLEYVAGANGMGGDGSITFTDGDGTHTPPGGGTGDLSYTSSGWTGGGSESYAPIKWDGENPVDGLSFQITKGFHRCVTWHDHVWLWADQNDPDTLFACDIDQPEGFTFMTQEGGYDIGVGDGDPMVQDCVPIGNIMYVLKTQSIYAISGYDFQTGEYAFQVQPQVKGYGVPGPWCTAVLENAMVFWSGRKFCRLQVGAYEVEHIGAPIEKTEGVVAGSNQSLVRVTAGDFQTLSLLNGSFTGGDNPEQVMRSSLALFAYADGVLMYDDAATSRIGKYAWSKWNGWNVGNWIPFGTGENSAGNGSDAPLLLWIEPPGASIRLLSYGTDPSFDDGAPIPWMAQTGWVNANSPELQKNLHRIFTEIEATNSAEIVVSITPGQTNLPNVQLGPGVTCPLAPTVAPDGGEAYNVIYFALQAALVSPAYLFQFTESGASGAAFELQGYALDDITEAITP